MPVVERSTIPEQPTIVDAEPGSTTFFVAAGLALAGSRTVL
jgi:hypothetical protein